MSKTKNFYKLLVIPALIGLMSFTASTAGLIAIDRDTHDFGSISEDGGKVSATFIITNNTDAPIALTNVRASCGCTTPSWTKEPIAPGAKGEVIATYSPKGRPGPFSKSVTITTNGEPARFIVHIKGVVE